MLLPLLPLLLPAAAPVIPYEGVLEEGGVPVDGSRAAVFSVYVAGDDLPAFEEAVTLDCSAGHFFVVLGEGDDRLPPALLDEPLELGITVGDEELQGRQRLFPVLQAHHAEVATDPLLRDGARLVGEGGDVLLRFDSDEDGSFGVIIGEASASFGRGAALINARPDPSATAPNPSLRFVVNGSQRMILDNEGFLGIDVANPTAPIQHSSGALLSAGGVWQDASSRELKRDIAPVDAAAAAQAVAALRPVTFAYKAEPQEQHAGFIAEEVPALVATGDRKTLAPMDVVAVLTKVVQEQQKTIAALNERVAKLEAREEKHR